MIQDFKEIHGKLVKSNVEVIFLLLKLLTMQNMLAMLRMVIIEELDGFQENGKAVSLFIRNIFQAVLTIRV